MFATQGYWENILDHVKANTKDLLTLLMRSKADSTVKKKSSSFQDGVICPVFSRRLLSRFRL